MESLGIEEVIHACGAIPFNIGNILRITGITTDSRKLQSGEMFVALKGENFDGHDYAEAAVKNGAAVVLSHQKLSADIPYLLVENTLTALHKIAKHYKNKFKIPFVAITGSSGKTTTKDMIASVLSEKYNVLKTEGNFNNAIGLPLTLFKLEKSHEIAVIEMGMNSLGEIEVLADIVRPEAGVITNVGTAHIEKLKNREGILKAKIEMFTYFNTENTAVINGDNDMLQNLHDKPYKIIKYGLDGHNDCRAFNIIEKGEEGISFDVVYQGKTECYQVHMPGIHNVYNALSAISIAKMYGLSKSEIDKGLKNFKPSKMRMEVFKGIMSTKIINDVYNANPDSMQAAINVLASLETSGRRVCILGDMFELGEYAKDGHRMVGKYAVEHNVDVILAVGKMAKEIIKGASMVGANQFLYSFDSVSEVIEHLNELIKANDIILIKGSRGMYMESIVESLREGSTYKC
ncbi:MAG: murF [Clostridia bacterium]|jgi:UDP-N-acetylmuramoyl-tripeptide--D-alanyl-D-alanine ligase|nr:murF [Clostridia bacterium]